MSKTREFALWAAIVLLTALFFAWQYAPAHEFDWKYDEGPDTVKASLLRKGYDLYTDIWSDHPPLFTVLLAGVFRVFGETLPNARLLVLALSCVGIVAVGAATRLAAGRAGALFAALAMALHPHFHSLSRIVLIGLPAIALGAAAIACAMAFRLRRRPAYLVLAALFYAASLLIKPITAPLYLCLSALLLMPDPERPRSARWRDWATFSVLLAAAGLAALAIYGWRMVEQVVGVFVEARATADVWANWGDIVAYVAHDKWGLSHLALVGLAGLGFVALAARRAWAWFTALALWLGAVVAALSWQTPLRSHELFLLAPPLIAAAGAAVEEAAQGLAQWRRALWAHRAAMLAGCLALAWWGASLPPLLRVDAELRAVSMNVRDKTPSRSDAVRFIEQNTPPDSVIITDDPMLAFLSRRAVPPGLVVSSYKRIEVGDLAGQELIALTQQAQAPLVALWRGGFERIPAYVDWVRAHYAARRAYEDGQILYTLRPSPESSFYQPARSEAGLSFWGADADSLAAEPGQALRLTLYWSAEAEINEDYTLFAHLIDADGSQLSQANVRPLDEQYRATRWPIGEMVGQEVTLTVPLGATPGEKVVAVGLRGAGKRLATLLDAEGRPLPNDQVILSAKPVVRWAGQYTPPDADHTSNAQVGDVAQLVGFDLDAPMAGAAREAQLTLYWKCLQPTTKSYTVFVHVLDAQGQLATQRDQRPGDGRFPTTGWAAGEYITDAYTLALPEGLPDGDYRIIVGMYDLATGARLAVSEQGQPTGDHIALPAPLRLSH